MDYSSTGLTSRTFINNFDNSFVCAAGFAAVASAVFAVADETVPAAFFFARLDSLLLHLLLLLLNRIWVVVVLSN